MANSQRMQMVVVSESLEQMMAVTRDQVESSEVSVVETWEHERDDDPVVELHPV